MKRLVEFSDRYQLTLELAYYPPYHSKYNLIERCWGILEGHWNGTLLTSIQTALVWAKTMTWRGVAPIVHLMDRVYETGVRLLPRDFRPIAARLERSTSLPKWSLIIGPQSRETISCGLPYTSMAELAAALTGVLHSLSASPTPTSPAGSPATPSPASGEQPRPAGSNSLVGQFLAGLAENKASPPIPTPEPVASAAPLRGRRRPVWQMIVAVAVLGVLLLGVIICVEYEPTRNRGDTANGKKAPSPAPKPGTERD